MNGLRSLSGQSAGGGEDGEGSDGTAVAAEGMQRMDHALLLRVKRNACSEALGCLRLDEVLGDAAATTVDLEEG